MYVSSSEDDLRSPLNSDSESFHVAMKSSLTVGEITDYLLPTDVVASFSGLFDKLSCLLQSCKIEAMISVLTSLKANDTYKVQLFPAEYIINLSSSTDPATLLRTLFPYCSWYDHSIIRELVCACNFPDAERALDVFDSCIDPTLPITAYPIPIFSPTMIPHKSSTHTVLAVVHNKELSSLTLQDVKVVKSVMVEKLCITKHACLFLAVADLGVTMLYWLFPKNVLSIIMKKAQEYFEDLSTSGMLAEAVYPISILSVESDDKMWLPFSSTEEAGMLHQVSIKHVHVC